MSLEYLENFSINSIIEQAPIPTRWKAVLDAATHGPQMDQNTRKLTRLVSTLLPLKFTIPIVEYPYRASLTSSMPQCAACSTWDRSFFSGNGSITTADRSSSLLRLIPVVHLGTQNYEASWRPGSTCCPEVG